MIERTAPGRRASYTGRSDASRGPHLLRLQPPNHYDKHMQSSFGSWPAAHDSIAKGVVAEIACDEVFIRTASGALAVAGPSVELPERLRMLLFLINGRRCMAEYRDLLPRYRDLDDAFNTLVLKGLIQRFKDPAQH